MQLVAVKVISAAVLFVVAAAGGVAALKVEALNSMIAIHVSYAFSAGILLAVALVHMLPENAEELDAAGLAFSKAFGGDPDEAFPLGNALFVLGFLAITVIESTIHAVLGDAHDHGASAREPLQLSSATAEQQRQPGATATDDECRRGTCSLTCDAAAHGTGATCQSPSFLGAASSGNSGGWATLVGLSIHSVVEGVATGAGNEASDVTFLVVAIACHKGFAAFALSAANLPLRAQGRKALWWAVTIWFAFSGPLGILIGALISGSVEGAATAAITCLAAGSLLSVGINEMLMPALHDSKALGAKLLAFTVGLCAMTLLAVWC